MSAILEKPPTNVSPEPTLKQQAVRGGVAFLTARFVAQLFAWTVSLLVARWLTPFDYGLLATGMIFVLLADVLAESGLGRALVQQSDLRPQELDEAFSLSCGLALLLYAVLWITTPGLAEFFDAAELTGFLRWLSLVVLLTPFRTVPLALLDRQLRLGQQSALHLSAAVCQGALVLGLAGAGFGYWALLTGALAARALETAGLLLLTGWRPRWRWPGPRARSLLGFGMHLSLGSLLWFAYSNADYAIVGKTVGTVALGFYTLAFQLMSLPVQKLTANINQVAYPVFCRLQHDPVRMRAWYLRLTGLIGLFGLPALTGLILVAPDAFPVIFGERWLEAVLPFQLLGGAGLVMLFSHSLPPLLNALGRPDLNLKYTALATVVFPVCFILAGMSFGLVGICLVWLIVYPLLAFGFIHATRHVTGVGLPALVRSQTPAILAVAGMAAVVLTVRWGLADWQRSDLRLVLACAAGAVSYAAGLWVLARRTVLTDLWNLIRELRGQPCLG